MLERTGMYIVLNMDRPDLFRTRVGGLDKVTKTVSEKFGFSGFQVLATLPATTGRDLKANLKQLKRKANKAPS